jgi:hypothetical protein
MSVFWLVRYIREWGEIKTTKEEICWQLDEPDFTLTVVDIGTTIEVFGPFEINEETTRGKKTA